MKENAKIKFGEKRENDINVTRDNINRYFFSHGVRLVEEEIAFLDTKLRELLSGNVRDYYE